MNYGGFFDFDAKQTRLNELTRLLEDPTIWNDSKRTQEIGREKKSLADTVVTLATMDQQLHDAHELFQLAMDEADEAMAGLSDLTAGGIWYALSQKEMRSRMGQEYPFFFGPY